MPLHIALDEKKEKKKKRRKKGRKEKRKLTFKNILP
jgi:hypothetical protein